MVSISHDISPLRGCQDTAICLGFCQFSSERAGRPCRRRSLGSPSGRIWRIWAPIFPWGRVGMPGGGKGSNWGRILHGWRRRGGPLIPDEFSGGTLTIRTWSLGWGQLSSSQNGKGKKFGGGLALLGIFVETRNFVPTAALLVSHECRFAPPSRRAREKILAPFGNEPS